MHIEFKRVCLHNFMSFGDATINFSDDGFIRVTGINENPNDNARSNGSGKSSLWESIVWALTGDTIRGTKQVTNLYGTDGCYVELEFNIDNVTYEIIRSKDHKVRKTSLQITIDGQDVSGKGIRDSEKLLQQYLPDLTASLLGSVIILGQGLPQKFTNNSPSGRKEVLEKLSKSDFMIEDLKTRVASRKSLLLQEQKQLEETLIKLESEKQFLDNQSQNAYKVIQTLDKECLQNQLIALTKELNAIEESLHVDEVDLDANEHVVKTIQEEHNKIIIDENTELSVAKSEFIRQAETPERQKNELQAELKVTTAEIARIQRIQDVCPTCGQRITDVHKPDTTELEKRAQSISVELTHVNSEIAELRKEYENNLQEIQHRFRDRKLQAFAAMQEAELFIKTVKTRINSARYEKGKKQEEILVINKELAQLETTIDFNQKIINENNEKINVIEQEFMYNNAQKDLTQSHIDVISKFDTALKRDFRGYLLSTVIDFIEAKAKQYSKVIFDTTDIGFCLDGNNIDISYNGKAYENLSGGEKQKIDLIIQFSIRDMLSSQLNFTSNILVLDEVFDGLDLEGCNRVIDLITSLSDVKNVFVVTHRRDLSIPSDKEVIVVKSSAGISEIKQ